VYKAVIDVKPLDDYKVLLTFEGNEKKVFDVKPYISKGIFKQLRDEKVFRSVKVSFDTIQWDNEADFCPEFLYEASK
jgi:hypothetical protein